MNEYKLHYIDSDEKLNIVIPAIQKSVQFGFDVEASSLDQLTGTLLLIQLFDGENVFVINAGKVSKSIIKYIFELINASNKLLIGHNIKFDMKYIKVNYNVMPLYVFDTQQAEVLHKAGLTRKFYRLDYLLKKYFDVRVEKDIRSQFINKTDFEFTKEQIEYAAYDVCFLPALKIELEKQLAINRQVNAFNLECRLLPVVADMELNGLGIDTEKWLANVNNSKAIIEERRTKLYEYISDNFNKVIKNPETVIEAFTAFNIPIPKTKKELARIGNIFVHDEIVAETLSKLNVNSPKQVLALLQAFGVEVNTTDKKTLNKFESNEFVSLLLAYREFLKDVTTYGEPFLDFINPSTGRIHPEFNPLGTATGRLSGNNPNPQNIKELYRSCIVADDGNLLATADYSQVELRVAAVIASETVMIDAFNNGDDLHQLTAGAIFTKPKEEVEVNERKVGKTLNFAVIYGTSPRGLYHNFGIPENDGTVYLANYFSLYKSLAYFIKIAGDTIIDRGYSVTAYGRRRFYTVPKVKTKKDISKLLRIKRQGVNHIIQGTSGDMIKIALCNIYYNNPFGNLLKLVNTVHDEIVVEFSKTISNEAPAFIRRCMIEAGDIFLKGVVKTECNINIQPYWSK